MISVGLLYTLLLSLKSRQIIEDNWNNSVATTVWWEYIHSVRF